LITCGITHAVDLELTRDLTVDSFIQVCIFRPVASSYTLVRLSLRTCYKGRGKSEGYAEHNQHAKHSIARGSGGMPPQENFKNYML